MNRMHQLISTAVVLALSCAITTSVIVESAQARSLGLGIQSTGSACCISLRFVGTGTLELDFDADRLLFVTARGLSTFWSSEFVELYAGAGVTLALPMGSSSPSFPLQVLQFPFGLEVTLPFLTQFAVNIEAALEYNLASHVFTTVTGAGIHFYF